MVDISIPMPELLALDSLKDDPTNPNEMTEEQLEKLQKMIKKVGFHPPVLCNKDLVIIDGHQRVKAARELGMEKVPVTVMPVTRIDHVILQQWYNKFRGTHDDDKDQAAYKYLQENDALPYLQELLPDIDLRKIQKQEGTVEQDEVDLVQVLKQPKYQVQMGEVWELGTHRVMCGDSTRPEHVRQLMNGLAADAVFIDPPYNLAFAGSTQRNEKFEVFANDKLQEEEYQAFAKKIILQLMGYSTQKAPMYVCIDYRNYPLWVNVLKEQHYRINNCIVWDKVFAGMGARYRFRHEFVIYATRSEDSPWYGTTNEEDFFKITRDPAKENAHVLDKKGLTIPLHNKQYLRIKVEDSAPERVPETPIPEGTSLYIRTDPKEQTDIWEGFSMNYFSQREQEFSAGIVHPTMKPLLLVADLLKNVTRKGDLVLDLCGGSGSTLMACHQINRLCCTMEIDPRYVSLILERFEKATGILPKRLP